eukprot:m.9878 g.9878  ORF g.9878 m.9878 type:complete len:184 (-) comp9516_c0_seq1:127-678(-)
MLVLATIVSLLTLTQASVDYEWTARFKGSCVMLNNASGNCNASAPSQLLSTTISPSDAVKFDVSSLFGSVASLSNAIAFKSDGTFAEEGQIAFGTHLSQGHTLFYRSFDFSGVQNSFDSLGAKVIFSMTADIQGGEGVFNGAVGMISYQGFGEPDLSEFTTYVSFIVSKPLNETKPDMDMLFS